MMTGKQERCDIVMSQHCGLVHAFQLGITIP